MKFTEIKIIKSVLSKELGWSWPLFLTKCIFRKRSIFKNTSWTNKNDMEAQFAKRLSISVAIYLELSKKMDKNLAFDIIKKIIVPIGVNEQLKNVKSLDVANKEPMGQLLSFHEFMDVKGVGKFVNRKLLKDDNNVLYYEVRNCFFARFYKETGTPELTKLFCEVDTEFFPKAFPEFKFHRGDSYKNTVAYGKGYCTFIFERKRI